MCLKSFVSLLLDCCHQRLPVHVGLSSVGFSSHLSSTQLLHTCAALDLLSDSAPVIYGTECHMVSAPARTGQHGCMSLCACLIVFSLPRDLDIASAPPSPIISISFYYVIIFMLLTKNVWRGEAVFLRHIR